MRVRTYNTILDPDTLRPCVVLEQSHNYEEVHSLYGPQEIAMLLREVFRHPLRTEEYLYLLAFNSKGRLLGIFEVSHGTVEIAFCENREIFMKALLIGASSIVLAHNHPSGDVTPSDRDVQTTEKVYQAGKLLGVPLADHIIVGSDTYFSFQAEGMMPADE
mgnify:CR=1 FL=1